MGLLVLIDLGAALIDTAYPTRFGLSACFLDKRLFLPMIIRLACWFYGSLILFIMNSQAY